MGRPRQRSLAGVLVLTTKDQYWAVFLAIALPTLGVALLFSWLANIARPAGL
jgi:hypothetical protein